MYGRPQTFVVPPFSQRSSYVPPQRQHVPMAGPSGFRSRYSWEEFHDDSDDSEADFDFSAAEEREFLRAEQQKRQAAARQQVSNSVRGTAVACVDVGAAAKLLRGAPSRILLAWG